MGHSERPLARIAGLIEEAEAAMDAAAREGVVTPADWQALRCTLRRVNGRVVRHDLEDAYGLAVARNGFYNDRACRLRRQLLALPPLDDDGPEPGAPQMRAA